MSNNLLQARSMGGETCVAFFSPNKNIGNCFSLIASGRAYKIINFFAEELHKLLDSGLPWPIQIKVIRDDIAVIHDIRIDNKHYATEWCESCCPKDLLPLPQQLAIERQDIRKKMDEESGVLYYSLKNNM